MQMINISGDSMLVLCMQTSSLSCSQLLMHPMQSFAVINTIDDSMLVLCMQASNISPSQLLLHLVQLVGQDLVRQWQHSQRARSQQVRCAKLPAWLPVCLQTNLMLFDFCFCHTRVCDVKLCIPSCETLWMSSSFIIPCYWIGHMQLPALMSTWPLNKLAALMTSQSFECP